MITITVLLVVLLASAGTVEGQNVDGSDLSQSEFQALMDAGQEYSQDQKTLMGRMEKHLAKLFDGVARLQAMMRLPYQYSYIDVMNIKLLIKARHNDYLNDLKSLDADQLSVQLTQNKKLADFKANYPTFFAFVYMQMFQCKYSAGQGGSRTFFCDYPCTEHICFRPATESKPFSRAFFRNSLERSLDMDQALRMSQNFPAPLAQTVPVLVFYAIFWLASVGLIVMAAVKGWRQLLEYALLVMVFLASSAELIHTSFRMVPSGDFYPVSTFLLLLAHHLASIACVLAMANLLVAVLETVLPSLIEDEAKQGKVKKIVIAVTGVLVLVLVVYGLIMGIWAGVAPASAPPNAVEFVVAMEMAMFSVGLLTLAGCALTKEKSFLTIVLLVTGIWICLCSVAYSVVTGLYYFHTGGFDPMGRYHREIPYYLACSMTLVALLGFVAMALFTSNEYGNKKSDLYVPLKDKNYDADGYLDVPDKEK